MMLSARFRRWLHLIANPWAPHRSVTVFNLERGSTSYVGCSCGRVWWE